MQFSFLIVWGNVMDWRKAIVFHQLLSLRRISRVFKIVIKTVRTFCNFRWPFFNCLIMNSLLVKCFIVFLSPKGADLHFEIGSKLMLVVYKGIAPGDERRSLPSLDISNKQLAEGLLHLAFAFGVRVRTWPYWFLSVSSWSLLWSLHVFKKPSICWFLSLV